jgi:hypothetical protein
MHFPRNAIWKEIEREREGEIDRKKEKEILSDTSRALDIGLAMQFFTVSHIYGFQLYFSAILESVGFF